MAQKFKAYLIGNRVISNASGAFDFYEKSRIGEKAEDGMHYSLMEAMYLLKKGIIELIKDSKRFSAEKLMKLAEKKEKNFFVKYRVYADLRDTGYIVKTALKFGADFRVYEKGKKPGEEHSKWIVFPVNESSSLTWHEFASKNRVAHSTKKNLLIAIVDDEGDVIYYDIKWLRP